MRHFYYFVLALIIVSHTARSATPTEKRVEAIRADNPITIDGKLTESIWKRPGFDVFLQRIPDEGQPSTQRTETWIAYDDDAIYVAARMYDTAPDSIIAKLTRRDGWAGSDFFWVELDPFHDKRTGVWFGMSAAGAFSDGVYYNDEWEDDSWDGIWEGKTTIDSNGWTAEFRIPLSQLRFHDNEVQEWGINFERWIARKGEATLAAVRPRNSSGFVSRFLPLQGIRGIKPPARIEFMPYVSAKNDFHPTQAGNPFRDGHDFTPGAGADLKFGIGSGATFDATINPDFGQVEVDPAVINLSDFETYFSEKRPFFIEGSQIFRFGIGGSNSMYNYDWNDPVFFYSRRIGRAPQGSIVRAEHAEIPISANIIGAGKLTGDLGSDIKIGAVSAVTRREFANLESNGVQSQQEIEPLTYYNLARIRKEFDSSFWSLGAIVTNAIRSFEDPALRSQLNTTGTVLALDGYTFLDGERQWVVNGWAGMTNITGSTDAITRAQRNSRHYFQRPDASHLGVDSSATSLTGTGARLWLNKQKGNIIFNAGLGYLDPKFDMNDLGLSYKADVINGHVLAGYKWTEPSGIMQYADIKAATARSYDFEGNLVHHGYDLTGYFQEREHNNVYLSLNYFPPQTANTLTRGGPLMLIPRTWYSEASYNSDDRKAVGFGFGTHVRIGAYDLVGYGFDPYVEWRMTNNIFFRCAPGYNHTRLGAQYVARIPDEDAVATYGNRYVFAELDQKTVSANIRFNWTFTPHLSLQLFLQPFISTGKYYNIKEFQRPNTFDFNYYGQNGSTLLLQDSIYIIDPDGAGSEPSFTINNPDFRFTSLRGNLVLRWEYLPGSTLYFVWTHDRQASEPFADLELGRDISKLFQGPADDIFLLKASYWFSL
jgi:hypothetical protein